MVVNRPDVRGREEILRVHTRKIPLADDVDLSVLARGTPGFSGADLANMVNEAALAAARQNRKAVLQYDFEVAKDKVLMGVERKSLLLTDEEKRNTAYHEAGHALVAAKLPHADPVHKVTIIPRGMALGLTMQLPVDDRHNYYKNYLDTQIAILMGGRIAEEIFLNQMSTGAGNDIERATELARKMVCEWGMSDLGPADLRQERRADLPGPRDRATPRLLGSDRHPDRRRSEEDGGHRLHHGKRDPVQQSRPLEKIAKGSDRARSTGCGRNQAAGGRPGIAAAQAAAAQDRRRKCAAGVEAGTYARQRWRASGDSVRSVIGSQFLLGGHSGRLLFLCSDGTRVQIGDVFPTPR